MQPLFDGKVEDQLIAYSFAEYLRTDDPTWPLLVPMVNSAVRAMDAVQQAAKERWSLDIGHFTVTGASKRGWTTWLTAAVDTRVDALAPMVIDMLNIPAQMPHQLRSWGTFSEQIRDYTDRGLPLLLATPAGQALTKLVDPYQYRASIVQPKLILLGTNDRYWPLDALNLYWKDLVGEKYVLYVPNKGHGLEDPERVFGTIGALHRQASGQLKLAKLDWSSEQTPSDVQHALTSDVVPDEVRLWETTAATRDFRSAKWTSRPITSAGDGRFSAAQPRPASGFAASYIETRFKTDVRPYYLTTTVTIVASRPAP
jgi:PhoPQ-activated pathogenicity-related protein